MHFTTRTSPYLDSLATGHDDLKVCERWMVLKDNIIVLTSSFNIDEEKFIIMVRHNASSIRTLLYAISSDNNIVCHGTLGTFFGDDSISSRYFTCFIFGIGLHSLSFALRSSIDSSKSFDCFNPLIRTNVDEIRLDINSLTVSWCSRFRFESFSFFFLLLFSLINEDDELNINEITSLSKNDQN